MFGDIFEKVGDAVGTLAGVAVAPIAVALGVSEALVKRAVKAGCRTQREIREWLEDNT
jgi:hypothetical protein